MLLRRCIRAPFATPTGLFGRWFGAPVVRVPAMIDAFDLTRPSQSVLLTRRRLDPPAWCWNEIGGNQFRYHGCTSHPAGGTTRVRDGAMSSIHHHQPPHHGSEEHGPGKACKYSVLTPYSVPQPMHQTTKV